MQRIVVALLTVGLSSAAAAAEPEKAPPFEEALAAAKRAGKPLVIDFGASWCQPCKMMDADLARPVGKVALQPVHFVRYDVDVAPGVAVREKFHVTSFPTLMAVDADGKEVDRLVGYGEFGPLRMWLEGVPDKAVSLTACLAGADHNLKNEALQLTAGKRLLAARRPAEARRYLARAAAAGEPKIAATAAWALADAEVSAAALPLRRKHAERVAARFASAPEGLKAFRFLATLPDPPRPLIASVVEKRLAAPELAEPAQLEELALYAMRAGAIEAAGKVADRLEAGADPRLSVVAEVRHLQGNRDRAVALGEKAVAAAAGSQRESLARDLERYRRGDKDPSPALAALGENEERRTEMRRAPPWMAAVSKITDKARGCAPADEPIGDVDLHVLTGERPEDLRVLTARPVSPAIAACLTKAVRDAEVPANQSFSVPVSLDPPWFAQGLALARKTAQQCLPPAKVDRPEPTRVFLTASATGASIVMAGGQTAVEKCIARAFWFLRPPPGTVRSLTLQPPRASSETKSVAFTETR